MAMVVLFASFKTTKALAQAVDEIGDISELNGSANIVRDKAYDASLNFAIQSNDQAVTSNGRMAITFLDDSTVKLTEHSQLTIDEYIFDPDPSRSKMALTFGLGTARFITGNLNRIDKQNIALKTPTADIAIRGTDFTATVDELGRSLIILLPDALGLSSGEIEVVTAMGTVILNKPYEATTVSVFESAPSKPVILDLDLNQIDNMLIVSPPKEEVYINYLDVNFLEDLLDIIDQLAIKEEEDQLKQEAGTVNIKGTQFGQDTDTQITSYITGETLTLIRSVSNTARVDMDKSGGYTIILIQDGVSKVITINGGGSSLIKITQSD